MKCLKHNIYPVGIVREKDPNLFDPDIAARLK